MRYLRYLRYIAIHKFWIAVYGWQEGCFGLALLHDWSKLLPGEFGPYTDFFYGEPATIEVVARRRERFKTAYLLHYSRNKHHWNYWVTNTDGTVGGGDWGIAPYMRDPMPMRYVREMTADWRAAGKAISGKDDALGWYTANHDKLVLHQETRAWVEKRLGYIQRPV